jgi:uncharacterized protein (TIGR03086 family)
MDIIELHERALDQAGATVDGVRDDQMSAPTPCTEWDVRALLAHLVGGNRRFIGIAEGVPPRRDQGAGGAPPDNIVDGLLGTDPAQAYRESAEALKEAWRVPGRLEQLYELPFGRLPGSAALGMHLVETVAHGWDLARATGQEPGFAPEIVATASRLARASLGEDRPPGTPFAPPTAAPEGASEVDRLAAFLGRDVS